MKDRSSPARSRLRLSSTTARGVPPQSSKPPKKVCYPYSVHNVRIVLLASVSGVSFCQGPEVAKQLLQEVADSAAHAASWRIEGSVKYRGSRPEDTHTSSFAVYIHSPERSCAERPPGGAPGEGWPNR